MALQPIDLQALFTQIDKVGKNQALQKEGLQIQQALQGVHLQRETDEQIRSVNETQDAGGGAEGVKERGNRKRPAEGQGEKEEPDRESGGADENPEPGKKAYVIKDPALGKNVDISG
jgi:hypothetical protein